MSLGRSGQAGFSSMLRADFSKRAADNWPATMRRFPATAPPFGSLIQGADAAMPAHAPADGAASMADGRPRNAHTIDSRSSHTAPDGNLGDHVIRRSKRRGRHAVCRCCNHQGEAGDGDQSEHCSSPKGYRARSERPVSRSDRISDVHWQTCIRPSSNLTNVPGVLVMPLRAA
jgi:hypothetical protein